VIRGTDTLAVSRWYRRGAPPDGHVRRWNHRDPARGVGFPSSRRACAWWTPAPAPVHGSRTSGEVKAGLRQRDKIRPWAWRGNSSAPPRSGRSQPDRFRRLLLVIRPARPTLCRSAIGRPVLRHHSRRLRARRGSEDPRGHTGRNRAG